MSYFSQNAGLDSAPHFLCNEDEYISERGAEQLVYGTGQYDTADLSNEVAEFFKGKGIKVKLLVPPKATPAWNKAKGAT